MLKSMTAYGRSQIETSLGRFVVEIQCVNRKHLEINLSLPKELCRFDPDIRKWIGERIHRGQITVRVFASFDHEAPFNVAPNLSLAKQIRNAWNQLAATLGTDQKIGTEILSSFPDLLLFQENIENEKKYFDALHEAFSQALNTALVMKEKEGKVLQSEILMRIGIIRRQIGHIEKETSGSTDRYREKLQRRLEEVLGSTVEDERVLKEVCLYADRVAITEELTRLKSHLDQCEMLLHSEKDSLGKTIDFLTQELGREANTIASKVIEIDASRTVVEMKGEIEKIRQQVQNVE